MLALPKGHYGDTLMTYLSNDLQRILYVLCFVSIQTNVHKRAVFFSGWPLSALLIRVAIECSGPKTRPSLKSGAQTWRTQSVRHLFLQPVRGGNRLLMLPNHTLAFVSVQGLPDLRRTSNRSWYLHYEYRGRPTMFHCVLQVTKHTTGYFRSRNRGLAASFYSVYYINHKTHSIKYTLLLSCFQS